MNERIEKLANRVLKEDRVFHCNDNHIGKMLASATDDNERLRIIKEEYAKIIETDENSLLAGEYPTVTFAERRRTDIPLQVSEAQKKNCRIYKENFFMPGGNHFSVDFEYVLNNGIASLFEKIDKKKEEVTDKRQMDFLDDLAFAAKAIVAWTQAYRKALLKASENAQSEKRRKELLEMADICERVPALPSTNFREAIQSYFFAFILFPDGLGRLDKYLYPFYASDIRKGILTEKEALCLTEELFIKIFAFLGRKDERSAEHHCVIAGYDRNGDCVHNECTSLILEAITELPTWRPQVSYRVTSKTTQEQIKQVLDANLKRPDLVMFLNDDKIVKGLVSAGVEYADAVNYSASGCNETILTGCSQVGALEGHLNMMHSLENMLKDTDKLSSFSNFDEFYEAYEYYLCEDLDLIFIYSGDRDRGLAWWLKPVESLLTTGCIDSATSITRGGAKYNFCTWIMSGLVNLADSLSIIRQMVFDEKVFTLTQLSNFLQANWEGYEAQRSYILNNGRYFGNDDDYVDLLINKVAESVNKFSEMYTPYRTGRYLFGTLTGYELSHLRFGKITGASPDGRYSGDPFSASIATFPGADKNGMTAYLKSAAKLDETLIQSSVVVNLKLDRAFADTEKKKERLASVLQTYFDLGGIQLQTIYVCADELIKAQKEPERYQTLRVRVTGFSGFFTSFDKALQDEIIKRYLHTN